MSDTHAWHPPQTVEQVLAELDGHIDHLRAVASWFTGEENQQFKFALVEVAKDAQDRRERIEQLLTAPAPRQELPRVAVPVPRPAAPGSHRVGEQTNPRLRLMRGNRRSL